MRWKRVLRQTLGVLKRHNFKMNIDTPLADAYINRDFRLEGWVFNYREAIVDVEITIGQNQSYSASYGHQRPDVLDYYGVRSALHSGFRVDIPMKDLPTGRNSLSIRATDEQGHTYQQILPVYIGVSANCLEAEAVFLRGNELELKGWFFWDNSQSPYTLHIFQGASQLTPPISANYSRPDKHFQFAPDQEVYCRGFRLKHPILGLQNRIHLRLEIHDSNGKSLATTVKVQSDRRELPEQQKTFYQAIQAIVDSFCEQAGREPVLLNYQTDLQLDHHIVNAHFLRSSSPKQTVLPYPDSSIDLVLCRPFCYEEAYRVARYKVLCLKETLELSTKEKIPCQETFSIPHGIGRKILLGMPFLPSHNLNSGSRHSANIVQMLVQAGWQVSIWVKNASVQGFSPQQSETCIKYWQQRGVRFYDGPDTIWSDMRYTPKLEPFLQKNVFEIAWIAHWDIAEWMLPALRACSPNTKVVVDSIDLHFLREARHQFSEPNTMLDDAYASKMKRELNCYAMADAVVTISNKERQMLKDLLGERSPVYTLPLVEDRKPSTIASTERSGIVFVGNYFHLPNRDAVDFLVHEVRPRLFPKTLEKHPIYIVGTGAEHFLSQNIADLSGVRVIGWLPDIDLVLHKSCVSVVPLRFGAGVKGKLLTALAAGVPTVSSSIGVEGLDLQADFHVKVADKPYEFAQAIESLIADEDLRNRMSQRGCEFIEAHHSKAVVERYFWNVMNSFV